MEVRNGNGVYVLWRNECVEDSAEAFKETKMK